MKFQEAIACAKIFRDCEADETLLSHLLTELEGRIALEIHGETSFDERIDTLSVPAPWSRLYWTYLVAMIDLAAGNVALCEQSAALFRNAYEAYARYYHQHHRNGA